MAKRSDNGKPKGGKSPEAAPRVLPPEGTSVVEGAAIIDLSELEQAQLVGITTEKRELDGLLREVDLKKQLLNTEAARINSRIKNNEEVRNAFLEGKGINPKNPLLNVQMLDGKLVTTPTKSKQ